MRATGARLEAVPREVAPAVRPEGLPTRIAAAEVSTRSVAEIHLRLAPREDAGDFAHQARSIYESLLRELRTRGLDASDLVAEKIFCADLGDNVRILGGVRREFFGAGPSSGAGAHAVTIVKQPPAHPGRLCEVQAFVLVPFARRGAASRSLEGLPPSASGKIVTTGDGLKHLFLSNVAGPPNPKLGFATEAARAFRRAESVLKREGLGFTDVVRTWIYLSEIDRDYADLNGVRRRFFASRGVFPAPASTGIQGSVAPGDRLCGLDLRAIGGPAPLKRTFLHAPTMNEAPSYGADFARGIRIDFQDRAVLYLSGTASIDTEGNIVHPGNAEGQVDRMLLNVEQLLDGQGAGYEDLLSATTYLKSPASLETFERVAAGRGLRSATPNTICVAGVCRPDWLCEMEAIAVLR